MGSMQLSIARIALCLALLGPVASALEVEPSSQPAASQPSTYEQKRLDALEQERARRTWQTEMRRISRRYAQTTTPEQREEILNELYALKDPEALNALGVLLNDDALELRRAAVTILSMRFTGTEDLPERLVDVVLTDSSDDIRYIAAGALSHADSPRALRRLLRTLRGRDPRSKGWSAIALGYLGDPQAVAPLIDALYVSVPAPASTTTESGRAAYVAGWDVVITKGAVTYQPRIEKLGNAQRAVGGAKWVLAPNLDAREALVRITSQDFGLDQNAWRAWWKDAEKRFLKKERPVRVQVPASRPQEGPTP
ncbi:MAG: HEAT repeat domain-containing protein [Planctomycetota bacterium]